MPFLHMHIAVSSIQKQQEKLDTFFAMENKKELKIFERKFFKHRFMNAAHNLTFIYCFVGFLSFGSLFDKREKILDPKKVST